MAPLKYALAILQEVCKWKSQRRLMVDNVDLCQAVEYACVHGYDDLVGNSTTAKALGLACALHGKNEEDSRGKTLARVTGQVHGR